MMRYLQVLLSVSLLITGCKDPQDTVSQELDIELTNAIISTNQSLESFILPESKDFSNIPQDPSNPLTIDKIELGKMLFYETMFSLNTKSEKGRGTISCATCHIPEAGFSAGIKQAIGEGGLGIGVKGEGRFVDPDYITDSVDFQPVKSSPIVNIAYQKNMLWNGSLGATGVNEGTNNLWGASGGVRFNHLGFEGVETQVFAAFNAHGSKISEELIINSPYKALFDKAYPDKPEDSRYTLVNYSLAIAAYERTVLTNKSPFQKWLSGEKGAMTDNQKSGAIVFFGNAKCVNCHYGPSLNEMNFYSRGMNNLQGSGVVLLDTGAVNLNIVAFQGRGGFTKVADDYYKFKVPQLYNLKDHAAFGHGSSFTTIESVLEYINKGEKQNMDLDDKYLSDDFKPLNLTDNEISLLVDFVTNGLYDNDLSRYVPEVLPTGNCFPNADEISKSQLGCD